jgi:hypothetical protein
VVACGSSSLKTPPALTRKEYDLLVFLAADPGAVPAPA